MINYIFAYISLSFIEREFIWLKTAMILEDFVKILSLKWSLSGHILNVHSVDFYNFM